MNEKVDVYVGRNVNWFGVVVWRKGMGQYCLEGVSGYPLDKLLRANSFWAGNVVAHHRTAGRCGIYLDVDFSWFAVDVDSSCACYCTVDSIAVVGTELIAQKIVGLDMKVVAKVGEMVMVERSCEKSSVAESVVDGVTGELDLIH